MLTLIVNLALIPVVMFYLLRDWNMIVDRVDELVPLRWQPKVRTVAREMDGVLAEFLHGQLLVMVGARDVLRDRPVARRASTMRLRSEC